MDNLQSKPRRLRERLASSLIPAYSGGVDATSVRVRNGRRIVTDGPFAETREQLGVCYLVEAQNLDQAIDIARRIPGARKATVEIRPVLEIPELPAD